MINVLIIDDDPMVAKFNSMFLQSIAGFTVAGIANSVEMGSTLLKEQKVDLILLDVYLGTTTGLNMLVELRKAGNPIDVIIITAANDKESVQTALHYGAYDYLIKPFSFERFQEALLQYKQKYQMLNNSESVSQDELDTFLLKSEKSSPDSFDLPKGMTKVTFNRIVKQIIERKKELFSAADLAVETGISRVSVRKYLNLLVERQLLILDVVYQETGRPLHCYKLNPVKVNILTLLSQTKCSR
ncbi:response regulator [bacterium LRH843]|nr:response regulator [bacterium LRH843]